MGESGLTCAFCKYQKHTCPHVNHILLACQSESIPKCLVPISVHLTAKGTAHVRSKPRYGLQSTKKIPFNFGIQLNNTLQQTFRDRFDIRDGTCHFKEDRTTLCSVCCVANWKSDLKETIVSVITKNRIIPGIGLFNN